MILKDGGNIGLQLSGRLLGRGGPYLGHKEWVEFVWSSPGMRSAQRWAFLG